MDKTLSECIHDMDYYGNCLFVEDVKDAVILLENYLDCDWRDYSKDTQKVVKDIQNRIREIFGKELTEEKI